MRRLVVISLVVPLAAAIGFAPAPLPRQQRRPAAGDVTGKWEFVVWRVNGADYSNSQRLEFLPGKTDFVTLDERIRTSYDLRLYPDLSPPAFEWTLQSPPQHWVGIYRLQGDRLTLAFRDSKNLADRPTDFAGKSYYYYELRRQSR